MSDEVPALVLPTEILAYIFTICLPPPPDPHPFRRFNVVNTPSAFRPSEAPLLVAGVCRRWRNVALSTPHLWVCGCLDFHNKRDAEGVVSSWLSRSLPYPLSFTLKDHVGLPQVLKETIPHCERWTAVEILISHRDPFAFNEVRGRLLCLTKLSLYLDSSDTFDSFAEAPLLQQVHITGGINLDTVSILLPWHQLTTLTCELFDDVECLEILRQCAALVDCSLISYDATRSGETILSHPPILLRRLRSLKLEGEGNLDVIRLLELPSLRVLRLEVNNDVEILARFMDRPHFQLESLCLSMVEPQQLLLCLPFLTSLVTLEVRTYEEFLTEELLLRLTHDPAVLPNLRTLDIDVGLQYPHGPAINSLREMILSRCLGSGSGAARNVCLETFRLVFRADDEEEEDGDPHGLMALTAELGPILEPRMVDFKISAGSDRWV
ncbi:hypothetical protein B0H16DRAFT_882954 [Mycena metata]|uniref:F-box domain-containing protein n=1 Tax=Mycena metata TaxID=1033252 RepID=A0AAD7K6R2_9AGAR|nr:hypothetical protein B0H16DRAFT_882954 [Mycena metata]